MKSFIVSIYFFRHFYGGLITHVSRVYFIYKIFYTHSSKKTLSGCREYAYGIHRQYFIYIYIYIQHTHIPKIYYT